MGVLISNFVSYTFQKNHAGKPNRKQRCHPGIRRDPEARSSRAHWLAQWLAKALDLSVLLPRRGGIFSYTSWCHGERWNYPYKMLWLSWKKNTVSPPVQVVVNSDTWKPIGHHSEELQIPPTPVCFPIYYHLFLKKGGGDAVCPVHLTDGGRIDQKIISIAVN